MKWSRVLKATIDVVQALCAVGLLTLGVIGYLYTVLPLYSKAVLEEEASKLKLDNQQLKQDNNNLQLQKSLIAKDLADYRLTVIPLVTEQFLTKIGSKAENYKCSPTVLDRGAQNISPPSPMTGAKLIETNLSNSEFLLLPESERHSLIKAIIDFVAGYTLGKGFTSELEIQHVASFTGPFAAMPKPWPDPFKFCEEERQRSERAFQTFAQALTALQMHLLPSQKKPIEFMPCNDLGLLPKCPNLGAPAGR